MYPPLVVSPGPLAELTELDTCVKPLAWPSISIKGLLRPRRPLIRLRLESALRERERDKRLEKEQEKRKVSKKDQKIFEKRVTD